MWPKENKFANLLTKQNKRWEYQPEKINIGGETYCPDFYLVDENVYIEVVGTRQAYHSNKRKYARFMEAYPSKPLRILDYRGNVYPRVPEYKDQVTRKSYVLLKKIKRTEGRTLTKILERAVLFYYKTFVEK